MPDRISYRPGDVAEVLVVPPFHPAHGVVVVGGAGAERIETLHFDGPTAVFRVPIGEQHVPQVVLSVSLAGPARAGQPLHAMGDVVLSVPPNHRRLDVRVSTRGQLVPGRTVPVEVTVRDEDGRPVEGARVALAWVDARYGSPQGYRLSDPFEKLHRPASKSFGVDPQRKLVAWAAGAGFDPRGFRPWGHEWRVPEPPPQRSGVAPGPPPAAPPPRGDASSTVADVPGAMVLWRPNLRTDARGQVTVQVPLLPRPMRYHYRVVAEHDSRHGFRSGDVEARVTEAPAATASASVRDPRDPPHLAAHLEALRRDDDPGAEAIASRLIAWAAVGERERARAMRDIALLTALVRPNGDVLRWPGRAPTTPFVTVHAAHALALAKAAGFAVAPDVSSRLLTRLRGADIGGSPLQAFAVHVRHLMGDELAPGAAVAYVAKAGGVSKLGLEALGWLWPVVAATNPGMGEQILSRLEAPAAMADREQPMWASATRALSAALRSVQAGADELRAQPLAQALVGARLSATWSPTHDHAYAVLGLSTVAPGQVPRTQKLPPRTIDPTLAVSRSYAAIDRPGDVRRRPDGTWQLRVGARVKVRLTVGSSRARRDLMLRDRTGPGLTPVGSVRPERDLPGPRDPDAFYQEPPVPGRPWYSHDRLLRDRVEVFAPSLDPGAALYEYEAVVGASGRYEVAPALVLEQSRLDAFAFTPPDVLEVR